MRAFFWVSSFTLLVGLLIGCGGGGSTVPPPGGPGGLTAGCDGNVVTSSLRYGSVWSNPNDNQSQLLQLVNDAGEIVRAVDVPRISPQRSEVTLNPVPAGVYELRVRLYAGPTGTGEIVRESRSVVDLCVFAGADVETSIGTQPASIFTFPGEIELREQQSRRVVAGIRDAQGRPAFHAPGTLVYDVQGGIGSVSEQGVFTATAAGQGSVRARYTPMGMQALTQVTVTPFQIVETEWTVLVYLNAANDLSSFSLPNVNQMERIADNDQVRFVVQWKMASGSFNGSFQPPFTGVRRYLVRPDDTSAIVSELIADNLTNSQGQPLDMGDWRTLREFVQWGQENFPAKRTALVIWNHGNGWQRRPVDEQPTRAFSYDDQYGTSIKVWELTNALQGTNLEILAWDASLMQMMEVAYEARDLVPYVVGSQESPPAEGYPYDVVFRPFRDNPTALTAALTQGFVDGMVNDPRYTNRRITQSSIRTDRLPALATALDSLAEQLIAEIDNLTDVMPQIRQQVQSYSPSSLRSYVDIVDLCTLLEARPEVSATAKVRCALVRQRVGEAVVHNGRNSLSPGSHGIGIDFSSGNLFRTTRQDYDRLAFAQNTRWADFLGVNPPNDP